MDLSCEALLGGRCNGGKCVRIAHGEIGEHFAVDAAAHFLQAVHEFAVGNAVDFGGNADPDDPQASEVALAQLAVLVVEREG